MQLCGAYVITMSTCIHLVHRKWFSSKVAWQQMQMTYKAYFVWIGLKPPCFCCCLLHDQHCEGYPCFLPRSGNIVITWSANEGYCFSSKQVDHQGRIIPVIYYMTITVRDFLASYQGPGICLSCEMQMKPIVSHQNRQTTGAGWFLIFTTWQEQWEIAAYQGWENIFIEWGANESYCFW